MRVRRGEGSSFVLGWPWVLRLTKSHSCVPSLVRLLCGYVKGEQLRGDCSLNHVSTLVFEPRAAPRVELKL